MPADTKKDEFDESNAQINTRGKRKGHRKEKRQMPKVRKGKQSPAEEGNLLKGSCLDKSLLRTSPKQLEATPGKGNHFSFTVICIFFIRLDVLVGNGLDHLHHILGFGNVSDKFLIFGFEELEQGPDRNVLERRITAGEESLEVAVNPSIRIGPVTDEN